MSAKPYRALFSSDWHFSNLLPYSKPIGIDDGLTDRLQDQINVMGQCLQSAREHKVEAVFLLGDLFDKPRPDPIALRELVRMLVEDKTPKKILDGNHDAQTLKGGTFVTEVFGALAHGHIEHLRMNAPLQPRPWLELQPVPYSSHATARDRLADLAADVRPGLTRVALIHQAIKGAHHQGWICDDGLEGDDAINGFDYVLAGHFHTTQAFGAGDRGMYLGAPMQHHFGDVGDEMRGWWIIDFLPGGGIEKMHVQSNAPRFKSFDYTGSVEKRWLVETNEGDYVRLMVTATHAEWVGMIGDIKAIEDMFREHKRAIKVQHVPQYHHVRRLEVSKAGAATDANAIVRNAIGAWFDGPATIPETFDKEKLRGVGFDIFEEAAKVEA